MEYTLDSKKHVEEVLKHKYKAKKVISDLHDTEDLNSFSHTDKIYYFGVISIGNNVEYCQVLTNNKKIIRGDKNSQIIEYFTDLKFYDALGVEITENVEGQFRGHSLNLTLG